MRNDETTELIDEERESEPQSLPNGKKIQEYNDVDQEDIDIDEDDLEYIEEDEEKQDFELWTLEELREYCEDNLLDIPENATKKEIIEVIQEAEKEMYDGGVDLEDISLESFGISLNTQNKVMFVIAIHNLFEKQIYELSVSKEIPDHFDNVSIVYTSKGKGVLENGNLIWTIDNLKTSETVIIKVTAEIFVISHDSVETGIAKINFKADSSFTGGLEVTNFSGLTRNKSHVDMIEKDEEPDVWDCNLVFENPSEFSMELVNVDVHDRENPDVNLVDFQMDVLSFLPSKANWRSNMWQYESEGYPSFEKKVDFRVMPELKTRVEGKISLQQVKLVLSSITGIVSYEVDDKIPGIEEKINEIHIPSYKDCEIKASLVVENDGSAPLNELRISQNQFNGEFLPPKPEELTLIWDGETIDLDDYSLTIDNEQIQIHLLNLKDTPMKMFEPGSKIEIRYLIHAKSPLKESIFETDVVYTANTYPKGTELEYRPDTDEVPIIKVIHIRRKFRIGKEIIPIGIEGHYQIFLSYSNIGDISLKNFVLLDRVPDNFSYKSFSVEPTEINDEVGTDTLKWEIESLEVGETLEIFYEIIGSGEYKASDAQLSL
ncbi:MAG: hypothetical protein ACFFAS_05775 [Promethearchaeota archaeon]